VNPNESKHKAVILKFDHNSTEQFNQFYGRTLLEPDEKKCRMKELIQEIDNREVDEEMIPYLQQLNRIPHVMTTQSGLGHDSLPYVELRWGLPFDQLFERVQPLLVPFSKDAVDVIMEIVGWEMAMPKFRFWMNHNNWRRYIEILIGCLSSSSPIHPLG